MKVNELSKAVESELTAYAEKSKEEMKKAVKQTASEIVKDISAHAPVGKTGKYKKSWRSKQTGETVSSVSYTVYSNKDGYRLAHLLEFGHAKRGGGKTRAFPHIKDAEERGEKKLVDTLREKLK